MFRRHTGRHNHTIRHKNGRSRTEKLLFQTATFLSKKICHHKFYSAYRSKTPTHPAQYPIVLSLSPPLMGRKGQSGWFPNSLQELMSGQPYPLCCPGSSTGSFYTVVVLVLLPLLLALGKGWLGQPKHCLSLLVGFRPQQQLNRQIYQ